MNGLEQILLKIEEDANAEVNKILKEAENESRDFVDKSVQNAEAEAEKLISAAKKKAALIAENAKSGSEAYIKREELAARADVINSCIEYAFDAVISMDTEKYFDILYKLILKYAHKEPGILCVNEKDLTRIPDDFIKNVNKSLEKYGGSVSLSDKPTDIKGGFIISYGGIEENCAFEELLEEKKDDIKDRLFAQLKA